MIFLLALIILINFALGVTVLISNYHKKTNVAFTVFTLFICGWFGVNFLADNASNPQANIFFTKLTMALGLLLAFSFFYFVNSYITKPKVPITLGVVFALASLAMAIASMVSSVIVANSEVVDGITQVTFGGLIIVYAVIFVAILLVSLYYLVVNYRHSRGIDRVRLKFMGTGLIASFVIVMITNLMLPLLFNNYIATPFGGYATVIFVAFTSYAIAKHKLLDIRFVVARSLAYIVLLAMLAAIYAGSVLGLERIFFPTEYNNFSLAQGALRTAVTVVMVFLFQPLKKWVTKVTDKIFFKNSYDKDELLGELSHTLGSTIVLIEMLYRVSDILTKEMKASRTLFALIKDESRLYTVQANGYRVTPEVDPRDVFHITKDGLMVADEMEDNSSHKRLLRSYDAAIAVPLKTDKEVVGVLLLGEKSSGDMYSQQDLNVLEIIAPEIAVAIENAKSYEEINRFNVTLRQEVKRATYRLKEKNTQLMELDKAKDEFISMASHQLRTPLTAIKGYLSMLLEGDAGDIKVSQYDFINEAYSGANRMVGLINDLLNVSRMETGRFFLEPKEIDIERVVEEEVRQLQNAAKSKGLYLKVEKKGKVPHIWADETKIRQVVMNFMDNAIYYTNTGGVTVVLSHDKDDFKYEVHDTGIGVPPAQRDHLFEKFFRADNARTARPDGTGLGIYLAKRVIEDHGGQIIFDSVEGKGSVFGFKFPLKNKVETKQTSAPSPGPAAPAPKMPTATEVAERSEN